MTVEAAGAPTGMLIAALAAGGAVGVATLALILLSRSNLLRSVGLVLLAGAVLLYGWSVWQLTGSIGAAVLIAGLLVSLLLLFARPARATRPSRSSRTPGSVPGGAPERRKELS
ncbi:hypothetical protein [Deinococcus pimensis]|uniref:hypothetical protein n=1 Tax=Deinococcus pimensis TaxID=309888 RepID=UPI000483FD04|nr:hypothetical protein [Deinococcus pimensis]